MQGTTWRLAMLKKLGILFHSLGADHRGKTYTRTRICGMNNCRDTHDRLLHVDKSRTDTNREDLAKTETTPTHKENRNQEEKRLK